MSSKREHILAALLAALLADPFFPDDAEIDAPEPKDWRPLAGGLHDAVMVLDGPVTVLREACGEGDSYELQLEASVAYAVSGAEGGERRSRRDAAAPRVAAIVADDRTLGVDAETYAEVTAVDRDDEMIAREGVPAATSATTIRVTYTAASPAD